MKKLNFFSLFFAVVTLITTSSAKPGAATPEGDIKWTTIDKALSDTKASNKKFILVDLYTDWCGWCKKMDEGTFTEASIVTLLNANFTPVKFNAETQSPVTFNGKSYNFNKSGARGANQLALDLGSTSGKLGYPTLVVLDANGNKLQAFPGYKDVETMSAILKYFQSGNYKTMDFQQFQSGQ
jgi:thioredoxin-related protein